MTCMTCNAEIWAIITMLPDYLCFHPSLSNSFQNSFHRLSFLSLVHIIYQDHIHRFPANLDEDVTIPIPPIPNHQRSLPVIESQHLRISAKTSNIGRPSRVCNTMRRRSSICGRLRDVSLSYLQSPVFKQ